VIPRGPARAGAEADCAESKRIPADPLPPKDRHNLLDSSVIFVTLLTPNSGETEDGLASPFFVCRADLTWI